MKTRTFNLVRDYYDIGRYLYTKKTVTFHTGLTVLVGCNGCGKTTMLKQIRSQLQNSGVEYVSFDNLTDGGSFAREKAGFCGDINFLAQSIISSEGENIMLNLSEMSKEIAQYTKEAKNQQELWIIMDAVDSGFSVDNIIELKDFLINTVMENQKDKDVYFIVSANEYELARGEDCMDTTHCTYRTFADYEEYRKFILETRKRKDKQLEG